MCLKLKENMVLMNKQIVNLGREWKLFLKGSKQTYTMNKCNNCNGNLTK